MSMKKPASLLAFVGALALVVTGPASVASPMLPGHLPAQDTPASSPVGDVNTALTSKDGQTQEADSPGQDPARVVGIIVQLADGTDRAAALSSVNEAVAGIFPNASVSVEREYANVLDGFALKAPAGSLDAIRKAPGVTAAFLEREGHVSDVAAVDAEGGTRASRVEGQDPANLSAQLMMRTDQVTQKGEGTVIAVIDTGVDMTHQAFTPALVATPALSEDAVDALRPKLGQGTTGVYVNEKFPFAYDYADGDNDASPAGAHGTHVAGITAANGDQIMGIAPDAQIIVAKVARSRGGGIPDSALLAALDDMATLHPDAVNMSLGRTAGMDSDADTLFAGVYEKLQEKGITLDVAGGNEFQAGYGNKSGKNLPYASDPDSSTLGEPGSFAPVVTVASIENARNGANGNYKMSDFSSWGVSPDMRLKPEVTAPGGNIYSSVPGGGYQYMSGTSMATPQITGVSAVVLERVQNDPLFSSMTARQKVDVVQNLTMGTAVPVTDPNGSNGAYYSPRKQGAGLVNVQAATTTGVYPTVNGATDASRPKADLGDGTNGWHFDVTLHNVSGTAATYDMSAQALSENISGGLFTGTSSDWNGKGVNVTFSKNSVTVPAKGEATVGIDITPGSQFAQYVSENAPSGTFLDGFVRFTSRTNGQADMTVPYLGFYGSWGTPSIFDQLVSEGDGHAASSGIYNGSNGNLLGYNPLVKGRDRQGRPNAERYVISRSTASGAPTAIAPRTGTLRSVHTLTTTYANEAGKSIASFTSKQNWKSVYDSDEQRMSWVEENHESRSINLNDYKYSNLPDGKYTLTIAATNDGPSPTKQSITYNFRVDTKAPVVESATVSGSTLEVVISDESPLAGFTVNDPNSGQYIYRDVIRNDADQTYSNGRYRYKATVNMSEIRGGGYNKPYVLAWDYGLNHSKATTVGQSAGNGGGADQPGDNGGNTGDQPGNGGNTGDQPGNGGNTGDQPGNGGNTGDQPGTGNGGNPGTGVCTPYKSGRWVGDGARWWYVCNDGSGYLRSGWYLIGNRYYYFGPDGYMYTGWLNRGGRWYYLNNSGAMETGWVKVGNRWYYMGSDGSMYTGTQSIDGQSYTFDDSGVWVK